MKKSSQIIKTFEEHLDEQYGKEGKPKRIKFETRAKRFILREIAKDIKESKKGK